MVLVRRRVMVVVLRDLSPVADLWDRGIPSWDHILEDSSHDWLKATVLRTDLIGRFWRGL